MSDEAISSEYRFTPPSYDVRKTDSTVSPYVAEVDLVGFETAVFVDAIVSDLASRSATDADYAMVSQTIASCLEIDVSAASQLVTEAKKRVTPAAKVPEALASSPEYRALQRGLAQIRDNGRRTYAFHYAFQDGKWTLKDCKSETKSIDALVVPIKIRKIFTP